MGPLLQVGSAVGSDRLARSIELVGQHGIAQIDHEIGVVLRFILERQLINTGVGVVVQVRIRLNHKGERRSSRARRHKGVLRTRGEGGAGGRRVLEAVVVAGVWREACERDV